MDARSNEVRPLTHIQQMTIMVIGSTLSALVIVPLSTLAGASWGHTRTGLGAGLGMSAALALLAVVGGSVAAYADARHRTRHRTRHGRSSVHPPTCDEEP